MWIAAVFGSFALAALPLGPAGQGASPQDAGLQGTAQRPAATAHDVELSMSEFDALVLDRHAQTEVGRTTLNHLLRAKLLDRLAKESKLEVSAADVDRKWRELEGDIVRSGEAASLQEYLAKNRVGTARFREFLRLGIVQERLARAALGIPPSRPINGEQQEMWLDQIVKQRGTQFLPAPWADGVAARCGDLEVRVPDFLEHLKAQLAIDDVREDCYQALLAKRARARLPELSPEAYDKALELELARRRAATEADERLQGASFEQVLASQGLSLEALRRDPAVVVATLSNLWVELHYGEDGLRRVYAEEREWFDARFGEARELRVLFLRGARFKSELNPRSFEDAERELDKLKLQAKTAADFERLAKLRSEDTGTRERGGLLGYVNPGDEAVPEPIRSAVFAGPRNEAEHCAGPVRLFNPSGAVLVWVGARRPSPGWDEMRARVQNELRRRFLDESLRQDDVVTYLDGE